MTSDGEARAVRVVLRGAVQGVGFRAWTRHQAQLHGASGWVRNCRDGSVEALLAGSVEDVALLMKALRQGPHGARVDVVEEFPATAAEIDKVAAGSFVQRETI